MQQPNTDIDALLPEELKRALQVALDELEEVEEMRMAVLGQTGVHIGASQLTNYNSRFERDQARLDERVARIRARLAALGIEAAKV
jgi:hypothetical protein